METEQQKTAAYLPFATFLTGIDYLSNIGLPNEIEMSTFVNMNPHNKAQMVSALKFFDLITKDNKPQPALHELVRKDADRKTLIRGLIETHYPDIVALDFSKMTPSQLDNALNGKRYNVNGETKKKAKTFLLKAAQHAGFTPHPLLTKITRNRRKGAVKQAAADGKAAQTDANSNGSPAVETVTQTPKPRGSEKTVHLRSGAGSVTLLVDVDVLALEPGEDQELVLKLRDTIRAYEKGSQVLPLPVEESNRAEKEAGE